MGYRFYNPDEEQVLDHDIELPLDDNVQLTVEEYRTRLYDVSDVLIYVQVKCRP